MNNKDKVIINIKEQSFTLNKNSGKIESTSTVEVIDIASFGDNVNYTKEIKRRIAFASGNGFNFAEAYLNMLGNIETQIKKPTSGTDL